MELLEHVTEVLRKCSQPYASGRYVIVPTLLSYENGRAIQAYVDGGADQFTISDGGVAAMAFVSLGAPAHLAIKSLKNSARMFGLRANEQGWIYASRVTSQHLPTYIAMIAECSQSADATLRKIARKQNESRDFKEEVVDELRRDQPWAVIRRKHIFGASHKQHVFDFAVQLSGDVTLVVDAVVPDPNSINSAVVSHLDVRQMNDARVVQRIVFNDRMRWTGADLALLGVGAPTIPFSGLRDYVDALAA